MIRTDQDVADVLRVKTSADAHGLCPLMVRTMDSLCGLYISGNIRGVVRGAVGVADFQCNKGREGSMT